MKICQHMKEKKNINKKDVSKMGKHKNSSQDQIFLNFMRNHGDIARGFVKGDRVVQERLWSDLSDELNASGPPIKDTANWKKAWIDWKGNIRKKLSHNEAEVRATGGGRFNQYVLSCVEEELAQICNLYQAVEGIQGAKSFGAVNPSSRAADKENVEAISEPASPQSDSSISAGPSTSKRARRDTDLNKSIEDVNSRPPSRSSRRPSISMSAGNVSDITAVIQEENKQFKNIGNMLGELVKGKEKDRKYIKSIDSTLFKLHSLKKEEIEEIKRHHLQIERSLVTKNELKLQFLKLEKLKLDIARSS